MYMYLQWKWKLSTLCFVAHKVKRLSIRGCVCCTVALSIVLCICKLPAIFLCCRGLFYFTFVCFWMRHKRFVFWRRSRLGVVFRKSGCTNATR